MVRAPMDGVPVPPSPPPVGGGVPAPKMGPGPSNEGIMGVPNPGQLASMFQEYTAGTIPREALVAALSEKAQGPQGIRGLLTELEGAPPPVPDMNLPPEHQELIRLLDTLMGLSREDAMALVSDITSGGAPPALAGAPPGAVPGPMGGGGPPMGGMMPPMGGGGPPGGGVPGPGLGGGMPL